MNEPNFLANLYPLPGAIPAEFDLPEPVNQSEYLIDGELRQWDGPMQEVTSPVCVQSAAGCSRVVIGCHPKLTGKESLEALAAASKAYDHGRGAWPTCRSSSASRPWRISPTAWNKRKARWSGC